MYTCIFRERERAGSSYQQNPKPANKNPPKKRAHISRRLGIICNIPPPLQKKEKHRLRTIPSYRPRP